MPWFGLPGSGFESDESESENFNTSNQINYNFWSLAESGSRKISGKKSEMEKKFEDIVMKSDTPVPTIIEYIKNILEKLQLEIKLHFNNIQYKLKVTETLKEQLDWESQVLKEEVEIVRNDIEQYEDYIGGRPYDNYHNETWEALKDVGRNELLNRKVKLQHRRSDLNKRFQTLCQNIKIYRFLISVLNQEEIKRQQRLQILSFKLFTEKFSEEELFTYFHQLAEEDVKMVQAARSFIDEMICSTTSLPVKLNPQNVLKTHKFGCTFDFVLQYKVNKGWPAAAYKDMVNIFERKFPVFEPETVSSDSKYLISEIFDNQMSRLKRENELYAVKQTAANVASMVSKEPILPDNSVLEEYCKFFSEGLSLNEQQNQTHVGQTKTVDQNDIISKNEHQTSCFELISNDLKNGIFTENEHKTLCSELVSKEQNNGTVTKNDREISCSGTKPKNTIESDLQNSKQNDRSGKAKQSNRAKKSKEHSKLKQPLDTACEEKATDKKNKKLMKTLQGKTDELTKSVSHTNSELSNIKEENKKILRQLEKVTCLLKQNMTDEISMVEYNIKKNCEENIFQQKSVFLQEQTQCKTKNQNVLHNYILLKALKVFLRFCSKNEKFRNYVQRTELKLASIPEEVITRDLIVHCIKTAVKKVYLLPVDELKKMETKELKLSDVAKLLRCLNDVAVFEEDEDPLDYSSDSSSSSSYSLISDTECNNC